MSQLTDRHVVVIEALLAGLVFCACSGGSGAGSGGASGSIGAAGATGSGGSSGGTGGSGTGSGGSNGGTGAAGTGTAGAGGSATGSGGTGVSGTGSAGSSGGTGVAGTGTGGASGRGGTSGGAGSGGAGGAGGVLSAACGAQISTPTKLCAAGAACPVVVDATLTCRMAFPFAASVAPGAGDAGYVTLTGRVEGQLPFQPQLIRIDPVGPAPTAEFNHIQAVFTRVVTDAAGTPHVFGDEAGAKGHDVGYASRNGGAWTTEIITPDDGNLYFLSGAALVADGRAFALFSPQSNSLFLATRAAAGGWSRDVVSTSHGGLAQALAVTSAGQPYVAYTFFSGGQHFLRLQQGTAAPQLVTSYTSVNVSEKVDVVAPVGGAPVVSADVPTSTIHDIHVFTPGAGGAYVDITVPAAKRQNPTGCESANCMPGAPTTCTAKAETTYLGAHALASAPDGAVYFAFTRWHVEFDQHTQITTTMPPFVMTICNHVMDADRSRTELVVARVPGGGATTLTELFHADLGNLGYLDGDVELDADARGPYLYLVVLGNGGGRYLLLDTRKLP